MRFLQAVAFLPLLFLSSAVELNDNKCLANGQRTDCGYVGIQQDECINKGCCWLPASNQPYCFTKTNAPSVQCLPNAPRQDCGFVGINQQQCESRGCCWNPQAGQAYCYFANQYAHGYKVISARPEPDGMNLILQLVDGPSIYGPDAASLLVVVNYDDVDRLRVRILDPSNARYEIPESVIPPPPSKHLPEAKVLYSFSYTIDPFGFAVTRKSDGTVIFNSTAPGPNSFNNMILEDQYLELSTQLPQNPNIYGLGEHVRNLKIDADGMIHTMWNRDDATPINQNIYGSHPFYLEMRNGLAHGMWLRNSNGMDVIVNPGVLTWRAIGGVLDMSFFIGPLPEQVTQQYHQAIGLPAMPPYWSLGFHQCRWGYHDIDSVKAVVENYANHSIPLDTIWNDIDYMSAYEDFSYDSTRFPLGDVQDFVGKLHNNGQHYVVIVDPGIHQRDGYTPWDEGIKRDIFIKRSDGSVFIGKVWPGLTAFPDFLNPNATTYWSEFISKFLTSVPVDGLWIDMNEISNFCNGDCSDDALLQKTLGFNPNTPPYAINNGNNRAPLNLKTIDMDCIHHGGILEYNVHNLYGLTESIATAQALRQFYNKRSLVISRSTFSSSGNHTGHWLGDNFSTFQSMALSVPGILAMNMFGIPLVGADVCGFVGSSSEELCSRWMELGAFYPFSRNHNDLQSPSQEPYVWPSVAAISRKVLAARYSILPYYNTLFFLAHIQGGTVVRPLFFEFPSDSNTLNIDQQFLVGPGLLVSPVLQEGMTVVSAYLPTASLWYDFWTHQLINNGWHTLETPIDCIQVHIRGGVIIPQQLPDLTTTKSRLNPWQLIVALDINGLSDGQLFLDDGEQLDPTSQYSFINFHVENGKLVSIVDRADYTDTPFLNNLIVLGVISNIQSVTVNGKSVPFHYDSSKLTLSITSLSLSLVNEFSVVWQ